MATTSRKPCARCGRRGGHLTGGWTLAVRLCDACNAGLKAMAPADRKAVLRAMEPPKPPMTADDRELTRALFGRKD